MALTWLSVNALDGTINDYLPNLVPQGPCAVTIGKYETLGFTIPYPKSVVEYSQAITQPNLGVTPNPNALAHLADFNKALRPGAAALIALDEKKKPIWGGLILTPAEDHTESATFTTATMEAYFARRYTGTYQTVGEDQNQVVADLINQFIITGTLPGIPIRVANSASTQTTSQTFNDYDDKTVYDNLQSMSGVLNGPQWTISWEWSTPTTITPVLNVADRIGTPLSSSLSRPNAVFSLPGPVTAVSYVRGDWATGKGANRVTATGQGQGLTRPESQVNAASFAGRPTFEFRYAPTQTALSTLTVNQHALAALAALQNGTKTLTLSADVTKAPLLGTDWFIGDDIGISVMAPAFIDGSLMNQVGHCIGWSRDDTTITPVLFVQDASTL